MPGVTKSRLLELFALGVPVYRQRFRSDASSASRERFYRLARACCALHECLHHPFESIVLAEADSDETNGPFGLTKRPCNQVIVFALTERDGRVQALPVAAQDYEAISRSWDAPFASSMHGKVEACAVLRVHGNRVVLRGDSVSLRSGDQIGSITGFWNFAKNWLHNFNSVPARYFHLYLGELCYRFNHHGQDLNPLLHRLIRHTSIQELRPLLTEKLGVSDKASDSVPFTKAHDIVKGFDDSPSHH